MSPGRYMMSQFARPHGLLAGVFGAVMNGGNRQVNLRSLEALEVEPGQRVLEVGFGGGATLEILLQEKACSYVGGLDPSPEMVRAAERRFASWIAEGRMAVRRGEAGAIPWADAELDRVLSVNSMFYWPDPARGAREIRRVLRPGGLLVLGLRDKTAADKIGIGRLGYWSPAEEDIKALLVDAGFDRLSAQSHSDGVRGDFIVLRGRKAAG
jgi:arsenite methyltransferase